MSNANESKTGIAKELEASELKLRQENSVTSIDAKKELENFATSSENKDEHEKADIDKEQCGKNGNSKNSDGKKQSDKKEINKNSKNDKNNKDESDNEENENDQSDKEDNEKEESEDELELGLLDRPVEVVTGCRARKFNAKKELENFATSSENKGDHEKADIDKEQCGKKGNSKNSDGKKENDKKEINKSSKNDKNNKEDNEKDESDNEENENTQSDKEDNEKEESEDELELGLLDRPVEVVTGCRARKQVERLEVSFALPKKDKQIPEGRGTKLGDCPRIEFQIGKHAVTDLKPLHRVLFNRQGTVNDTKKNIRKFSGFPFDDKSYEFEKTKAKTEKYSGQVLKKMCEVLDLERSGSKDDIIMRILQFLVCPSDSGKELPKKKSSGRDKKTAAKKKNKSGKKKSKPKSSEEEGEDEVAPSADEASDVSADEEETSDMEIKKKSNAKNKKTSIKVKMSKKEKPNKEGKGIKRKKNVSDSSDEDSEQVAKKSKLPNDEEIEKLVKTILEKADLHEITMKKVIKQVYDTYPGCDLTDKKSFIKQTIKSVLQLNEKGEAEDR